MIEEFVKTLEGRLHALAIAHATLAKSHWKGAWLRDILTLTLQPYMVGPVERIKFIGPDIELLGMLARPMCMVIHELATNAVKYGSLSTEEGSVLITSEKLENGNVGQLQNGKQGKHEKRETWKVGNIIWEFPCYHILYI